MSSRRSNFERPLRRFLTFHHFHVWPRFWRIGNTWLRCPQQRLPLQMIQQGQKVRRGNDLNLPGPCGLRPLHRRTNEAHIARRCVQGGKQYARRPGDLAVKPKFPDDDIMRQRFRIDQPHRRQQRQRDWQIIMRAFFGQVGR